MEIVQVPSPEEAALRPGVAGPLVRSVPGRAITVAAVVVFAFLTWAGARVSLPLPFTPVPVSLQTLAVLLSGAFLGARAGAASQILYLMMGLGGLPVFALPGSGPGYLLGPTGGYLLGFVAAAYTTGLVLRRTRALGIPGTAIAMLAGSAALYACGVSWLFVALGFDLPRAVQAGLLPFAFFDLAKIAIAAAVHAGCGRLGRVVAGRWRSATGR